MNPQELLEKESLLSDDDILEIVLKAEQQMQEAVEDCINGLLNPLIIKGPPGVGKTETIKIMTKKAGVKSTDILSSTFEKPADGQPSYPYECTKLITVDGALIRGSDYAKWALVADLYANRNSGILTLDDNDGILQDVDALSVIMQATEQSPDRTVKYVRANSTHELQMYGVDPVFSVRTPLIILTNIDMKGHIAAANLLSPGSKAPKIKKAYISRWEAMVDRGTYIDLKMNSPRSIRVYCENKIISQNILTKSKFLEGLHGRSLKKEEEKEVLRWIRHNQAKLADPLTLRTYNKVAAMLLQRKHDWQKSAEVRYLRAI